MLQIAKRNKVILVCALFTLLFFIGCGEEKSEDKTPKQDETQIAAPTEHQFYSSSLKLSFIPPQNWELKTSEVSEKNEFDLRIPKNLRNKVVIKTRHIFFDKVGKSLLTIGTIESRDTLLAKGEILSLYKSVLENRYKANENNFIQEEFAGLNVTGIQIKIEKLTTQKFLFFNNDSALVLFDYSFNESQKKDLERYISSSIESVRLQ